MLERKKAGGRNWRGNRSELASPTKPHPSRKRFSPGSRSPEPPKSPPPPAAEPPPQTPPRPLRAPGAPGEPCGTPLTAPGRGPGRTGLSGSFCHRGEAGAGGPEVPGPKGDTLSSNPACRFHFAATDKLHKSGRAAPERGMLCARRAPRRPAVPGSSAQWPPQYRPPGPRRARGSPRRGQLKTWRPACLASGPGGSSPTEEAARSRQGSAARPRPEREAGVSGARRVRARPAVPGRGGSPRLEPGRDDRTWASGLGPLERPPCAPAEPRCQVPTRPRLRASVAPCPSPAIGATSLHPEPW